MLLQPESASGSSGAPELAGAASSTQDTEQDSSSSSDKEPAKKKKNKCQSCKKKVGLTGELVDGRAAGTCVLLSFGSMWSCFHLALPRKHNLRWCSKYQQVQ